MTDLQKLLGSFVTVIVRYHGAITSKPEVEDGSVAIPTPLEVALIAELLEKPMETMISDLEGLITAATKEVNTRRTLLEYLLYGIKLLRTHIDKKEMSIETTFSDLQEKLTQLIVDIHFLMSCTQTFQRTMRYNDTDVNIFGLRYLLLPGLCTSGTILRENVLIPLEIGDTTSPDIIKMRIGFMLKDHQYEIFTRFLVEENSQLQTALHEVTESLSEVSAALADSKSENAALLLQYHDLEEENASLAPAKSTSSSKKQSSHGFFDGLVRVFEKKQRSSTSVVSADGSRP